MILKLVVTTNVNGDVFELILKNARYGVGRRHDNDLRIKETYISGYHAELVRNEEGDYEVSDLGSSNGTFLNGRRVSGKEVVKAGDFIKFGILKVAVEEHTETMPKIVALKDRPVFARKDESNTAAIAVEKKTGSVAVAGPGDTSGDTRATSAEAPPKSPDAGASAVVATVDLVEIGDLRTKLATERAVVSDLKREVDSRGLHAKSLEKELGELRRTLEERERGLQELALKNAQDDSLAKELKAREAELTEARKKAETLAAEVSSKSALEQELRLREKDLIEARQLAEKLAGDLSEKSGLEKALKARETELGESRKAAETFAAEAAAKVALETALKSRERELAEVMKSAEQLSANLARFESEAGSASGLLREKSTEADRLAKEVSAKEEIIARLTAERDSLKGAVQAKSGDLIEREEVLAKIVAERDSLKDSLKEKEGDLAASVGEIAKLAALAASISTLEHRLGEARSRAESEEADRVRLMEELRERDSILDERKRELGAMKAEIASLSGTAEKNTSQLSRELEEAKARAAETAAELASVRAELESERKSLAASSKEHEREGAKVAKTLSALEAKHAKQTQDLNEARSILQEREKELKAAGTELKKSEKILKEVESLRLELETVRSALKEAATREAGIVAAESERVSRIGILEEGLREAEARSKSLEDELGTRTAASEMARSEVDRIAAEFETFRREQSAEAASAMAGYEREIQELRTELGNKIGEAEEVRNLLAESRRHADEAASERSTLLAEREELRLRGDGSAAEVSALRSSLAALLVERDELRSLESNRSGDVQSAKAEANDLRIELRKVRESAEGTLRELETALRSRIAELETSLGGERVRATDTLGEKTRLQEDLTAACAELETLREESAFLRVRNEEAARNNGKLQAELNRETTERSQMAEALEASRVRANGLLAEVEVLKHALEGKAREIAEREQQFSRSESETVQKIKRELSDALSLSAAAEEKSAKALKEKQTLAGAFERLKEQLDQTEASLRAAREAEEELNHGKGLIARRLEKAESSNSELAARIKEEAMAALTSRNLIEKLELQLRENETAAVQREREQVSALQADLSRSSRRAAEDERRRRDLEAELVRVTEARKQSEERIVSLEARLVEQEAETLSTRGLLNETEKKRVELASRLAAETALVESHIVTIDGLRRELSDAIARFSASETALIARHGVETDSLLAELRGERSRREDLEVELTNTRDGLSEALHNARAESVKAQARLVAEGNAKLSAVEEELSAAIRSRETIEESRNVLEDELNQREEEIEGLSERIENLGIRLRDEIETRHGVLRELETTRAGFSESLRSGWNRLDEVRASLGAEQDVRKETEGALLRARDEIERLSADLEQWEIHHRAEIREWEDRYEALRSEKLTLASEDADLRKIREEILAATAKRRAVESELAELGSGLEDFQSRQAELRLQRESLLSEREELKAALNAARSELGILQKRCVDSKEQEAKHTEAITAAERRIQSLRKLESEMELAVERRRQAHLLNRGEVFSEAAEFPVSSNDEFSQEEFYRKLIVKLDLIDDLAKRYDNKWLYPKVAEQLGILKRGFVDFLNDHSVRQFDLEPGTVLSVAERKRIKLVPLQNGAPRKTNGNGTGGSHNSLVVETLRPGYIYQNGSRDVIIRKAEVVVS